MRFGEWIGPNHTYWYDRVGPKLYLVQHNRLTGENHYISLETDTEVNIDVEKLAEEAIRKHREHNKTDA